MDNERADSPTSAVSRSRLEFLFDGIFAIAMTLLVLDLKVPEIENRHSVGELARALGRDAPTFISYLISFAMLGILWYKHNKLYRHFRHISGGMLVFQFLQMCTAAFFPFCAALLGRHTTNSLTILVYTGCLMAYFWSSYLGWLFARRANAIDPALPAAESRKYSRNLLRGALILTGLVATYAVFSIAMLDAA